MNGWKNFLDTWSTEGGILFLLFILHNILLACLIIGHETLLKESYFLVLGALLGLMKGEWKNKIDPPE
jgi:hypothetical protein